MRRYLMRPRVEQKLHLPNLQTCSFVLLRGLAPPALYTQQQKCRSPLVRLAWRRSALPAALLCVLLSRSAIAKYLIRLVVVMEARPSCYN